MMWSSITLPKAQTMIATSTLVASSYFFAAYRAHDQRAISEEEVICARDDIAYISPLSSASLLSSPVNSHSYDAIGEKHLLNLTKYGATVVNKTLSPPQLDEWNSITKNEFDAHTKGKNSPKGIVWQSGRAHYHISQKSMHYNKMTRIGCKDCNDEISIEAINSSSWWGGLWRRWRRRKSNNIMRGHNDGITEKALLLPRLTYLQDIVQSYFQQHGIQRYILTDMQFLNAYPNSTNQIWHRDNTRRGLTAIVALCNIRDNGPTELILGSHQSNFSVWSKWWNGVQICLREIKESDEDNDSFLDKQHPPPLLLGCIDAGDTLLYDARIFHRGRGYDKAIYAYDDEGENVILDRTVLVLRWDSANTPPPGAGIIVTSVNACVGSLMYASLSLLHKLTIYYKE